MATLEELCYMPATRLATAIQKREISPVEVTDALLQRIERINPKLNAFTVVLVEEARAAAQKAEEAVLRGASLGLLHGIPFAIKDLTLTKGVKTMFGSKVFANNVPEENGVIVDRLLQAGGIFLAKTTTPEFGNKGITVSPLTGTTNNPWKTTHTVGGSSGGSATAIAAGFCPIAEGGDGGGSVRIPASCCGVVGLKPSFGRVPFYGMFPVFETLVHHGCITRTVADAALMLNAVAGPDDRDPFSLPESGVDYLEAIDGASIHGMKVAYSRDLGLGVPLDPQVVARTDAAVKVFADQLGAIVEEATLDNPEVGETFLKVWSTVEGTMTTDLLLPNISRKEIDPSLLDHVARGEKLSAFDFYRAAILFRELFYQKMVRFMKDYDLLITPTITTGPFPHPGWAPGPAEVAGKKIERLLGWLLTYPFNMTGQPAISVPCGFSDKGLPIGLQIVGRRHADVTILRAAAAYEQAAPWSNKRPPIE